MITITNSIEKKRVQRAFSRCAQGYENNAQLQKEIAQELVARLLAQPLPSPPTQVLEVGVGTGYLARQLRRRMPFTQIFGCDLALGMLAVVGQKGLPGLHLNAADAENLPYRSACFELVISSLTYQWLNQLKQAIAEAYRVLKTNGQLCLATLGPASLQELRDSFGQAHLALKGNWPNYLQEFPSPRQWEELLQQAGFAQVSVSSQLRRKVYPSPNHLLRTLRGIGATNASRERPQGLASRGILRQMEQLYCQSYPHPEGIWATYEIVWVRAVKL